MAEYIIRRHGPVTIRIVQVALILMALVALLYAIGAPHYQGG
jgi:hypothetical protein